MYTKFKFNAGHELYSVIEAMHNLSHRLNWDKNLMKMERSKATESIKGVLRSYQIQKGKANVGNRDSADKII